MATVPLGHIEITPGVCGGRPRIAGHRIRVQDIVSWHEAGGMSPDEIVSEFPQLTLADVYAALTYYHDHRDEIQGHIEADEQFVAEFELNSAAAGGDGAAKQAGDDSIPS